MRSFARYDTIVVGARCAGSLMENPFNSLYEMKP